MSEEQTPVTFMSWISSFTETVVLTIAACFVVVQIRGCSETVFPQGGPREKEILVSIDTTNAAISNLRDMVYQHMKQQCGDK